jgi:membrane-associated protease RseP (regulator of RpoE activity)
MSRLRVVAGTALAVALGPALIARGEADTPRSESGAPARRPDRWPEAKAASGATLGAAIHKNNEILALWPGSPAERAGLQVGDVITHVDGTPASRRDIERRLKAARPGSVMRVTVRRERTALEVEVGLAQSPPERERLPLQVHLTVEPSRTTAGQEVSFAARYVLTGPQPVEVVERREIVKDEQVLGSWEDTFTRSPGRIASEKPVRLAPQAPPGRYLARITLCAEGRQYRAYADFEVRQ